MNHSKKLPWRLIPLDSCRLSSTLFSSLSAVRVFKRRRTEKKKQNGAKKKKKEEKGEKGGHCRSCFDRNQRGRRFYDELLGAAVFLFSFSFFLLFFCFFVQPDCACGLFGFCFFRSSRRRAPASFARRPTNRSCRRSAPNCWPLRFLSLDAMQKQKGKKKENSSGGGGGGPGSVHLLSKSAALGPTGSRPAAARRSRSQRQSVPE